METLTRIYIYFMGIIALMVCFLAWVSIRLRAERINRIRLEKRGHEDFNKIFNLEYEIKGLKRSIESLDKIIEGNKQINQSNESTIKILEERIERQVDIIKELEQDKDNLTKCIERTGIRGTDGVVRRCNLGHIQSVISGTHPILMEKVKKPKKAKEVERGIVLVQPHKITTDHPNYPNLNWE
jgi:hypothetical protein